MLAFKFRLFTLVLVLFCVTLVVSAPLPEQHNSLDTIERRNEDIFPLMKRSPSDHEDVVSARDISLSGREDTLFRPRNFFSSIGDAFKKAGDGIKKGVEKVGQGVKKGAEKVGQGVKKGAEKVGQGVKKVAQKAGQGVKKAAQSVKKVAQKAGQGVKKAADKVKSGVKTAVNKVKEKGPSIGKVALKGASTAASVGGKVAGFVPGGKIAGLALKGASAGIDIGAEKIQAPLDPNLQKSMDIMDKIQNPGNAVGGPAGAIINALRRDMDEHGVLVDRDGIYSHRRRHARGVSCREYD